jgi:hypothetical protein
MIYILARYLTLRPQNIIESIYLLLGTTGSNFCFGNPIIYQSSCSHLHLPSLKHVGRNHSKLEGNVQYFVEYDVLQKMQK